MSDEQPKKEAGRAGLGILSDLRDALEEVIAEARDRGDLSAERAREAFRNVVTRARDAAGEAKERLDFATQGELQEVRDAVAELKVRLENLERRAAQDPSAGPARPEGTGGAAGAGPTGSHAAGGAS